MDQFARGTWNVSVGKWGQRLALVGDAHTIKPTISVGMKTSMTSIAVCLSPWPTTAWSTWMNFDPRSRSPSKVAWQLSGGGGGIRTLDTLAGIAV